MNQQFGHDLYRNSPKGAENEQETDIRTGSFRNEIRIQNPPSTTQVYKPLSRSIQCDGQNLHCTVTNRCGKPHAEIHMGDTRLNEVLKNTLPRLQTAPFVGVNLLTTMTMYHEVWKDGTKGKPNMYYTRVSALTNQTVPLSVTVYKWCGYRPCRTTMNPPPGPR
jgi:hypothetical protein